jgi:hypothetical protein
VCLCFCSVDICTQKKGSNVGVAEGWGGEGNRQHHGGERGSCPRPPPKGKGGSVRKKKKMKIGFGCCFWRIGGREGVVRKREAGRRKKRKPSLPSSPRHFNETRSLLFEGAHTQTQQGRSKSRNMGLRIFSLSLYHTHVSITFLSRKRGRGFFSFLPVGVCARRSISRIDSRDMQAWMGFAVLWVCAMATTGWLHFMRSDFTPWMAMVWLAIHAVSVDRLTTRILDGEQQAKTETRTLKRQLQAST